MSHKALARDSPGSILRKLKQLDESERVLHAKLLALSAERALLVSSLSELLQNDESETASSASTRVADLECSFEDDLSVAQERSLDYVRDQRDAYLSRQSVENVWGTEGDNDDATEDDHETRSNRSPTPTQAMYRDMFMRQASPSYSRAPMMSPVAEQSFLEDEAETDTDPKRQHNWTIGDEPTLDDRPHTIDYESEEMNEWRVDPSQSSWYTAWEAPPEDEEEIQQDVSNILGMDVTPSWPFSGTRD